MKELKDSTVLVTGAAHGIGTGFARRFQKEGAKQVLVDIDGPGLEKVRQELGGGDQVVTYEMDLSSKAERERLYNELNAKGIVIDVLVNNMGVGYRSDLVDTKWEKIQQIFDVDVIAPTHLIWLWLPEMKKRNSGAIINLSSTGAFCGANTACVYTGGKAYIMNFTEGLDMELFGTGVRVISAHPGATDTKFWNASGWENSDYNKRIKMMSGDDTANEFVDALLAGKKQHIAGLRNRIMVFASKFVPREMLKRMAVQKYK